MAARFEGKTAVVTGAASGIGRRIAERLAAGGAAVLLADANREAAQAVAAALEAGGSRADAVVADVTRAEDCGRMVETAVERWGGLDLLVNSAGIGRGGAVAA